MAMAVFKRDTLKREREREATDFCYRGGRGEDGLAMAMAMATIMMAMADL